MKRTLGVTVILMLLMFSTVNSFALQPSKVPPQNISLSFSGSKAICTASINDNGARITVTVELWQGTSQLHIWGKTGSGTVSIYGTNQAVSGKSYTMKVYKTKGGATTLIYQITKTCP